MVRCCQGQIIKRLQTASNMHLWRSVRERRDGRYERYWSAAKKRYVCSVYTRASSQPPRCKIASVRRAQAPHFIITDHRFRRPAVFCGESGSSFHSFSLYDTFAMDCTAVKASPFMQDSLVSQHTASTERSGPSHARTAFFCGEPIGCGYAGPGHWAGARSR